MANTKLPQSAENVFPTRQNREVTAAAAGGVGQDKRAFVAARIATSQPAPVANRLRPQTLNTPPPRSQTKPIPKRKTEHLTLWVKPGVKAELQRKAAQEGISVSAAGSALLEQALQHHIDMHYGAFLQPIIEQAIRQQMQGISTRLAWLLVRVAFDAGQTRNLVTNILGRQAGVTPDMLKTILEQSSKAAKGNITRKTPQLTELMEAIEQWLRTDNTEQQPSA
jgi:hypothetical protein